VRQRLVEILGVLFVFGALTAALTWPQAILLATEVPSFDDSLLSIWRIAWIAHAIGSGLPVADANIFYPEARTLAYTDAVLLQGMLATPFLMAGASPVLVYNLLILGSITLSGAALYLLARRFTDSWPASLVAGTIFAFVTYRFDHIMHLELQATIFMPLALWFLDRSFEAPTWRNLMGFGACVLLQLLSGIYYTVFLATALAVAIPVRWLTLPTDTRRTFAVRLAAVALVAAVCALPYLFLYTENRTTLGERTESDIRMYSATPINYLASEPRNLAHGLWSGRLGRSERYLFPGVAAIGLALLGLGGWSPRKTMIAAIAGVGFVISLGLNTPIYVWIRELVFAYRGLRAPARAAVLVTLAISLFAAYGWAAVLRRHPRWKLVGTGLVMAVLTLEYATFPGGYLPLSRQPSALARWLSQQPTSVIVEFPIPKADALYSIQDGLYMYASTFHWQPTLNGYSGFYPRSYLELLDQASDFPSDRALEYLKSRRVDLIVLHGRHLKPDQFGRWAAMLAARKDVDQVAQFPEQGGDDLVFRLRR
jgi:hypothetical protein